MSPIENSGNDRRNPLVELPIAVNQILDGIDAVVVTHLHRDHWDDVAALEIPKHLRIICQAEDAERFHDLGFDDVRPIHSAAVFGHVGIYRTEGRHGTGEIGKKMGRVSGFFFKSRAGESIYVAGDTIYANPVRDALMRYRPTYTVVNCGGARFVEGDPITMTAEDVAQVVSVAPFTKVIAVHMDAINHCMVSRNGLKSFLKQRGMDCKVAIPADGQILAL